MDDTEIPQDVQVLLFQDVHTFEQLEALLLLRGDPTVEWSAAEVASRLRTVDDIAQEALDTLGRTGLVAVTGVAPGLRYRYSPSSRTLDEITAHLASAYQTHRFEVLRLISHNAVERVRTSAMRMFANAFILRSKNDKDEGGDE